MLPSSRSLTTIAEEPVSGSRVLLHSCCAPCSDAMVEAMDEGGYGVTIHLHNPNIRPREEYEIQKDEKKRFANELGVPFIDADFDVKIYCEHRRRGARSADVTCFDLKIRMHIPFRPIERSSRLHRALPRLPLCPFAWGAAAA